MRSIPQISGELLALDFELRRPGRSPRLWFASADIERARLYLDPAGSSTITAFRADAPPAAAGALLGQARLLRDELELLLILATSMGQQAAALPIAQAHQRLSNAVSALLLEAALGGELPLPGQAAQVPVPADWTGRGDVAGVGLADVDA